MRIANGAVVVDGVEPTTRDGRPGWMKEEPPGVELFYQAGPWHLVPEAIWDDVSVHCRWVDPPGRLVYSPKMPEGQTNPDAGDVTAARGFRVQPMMIAGQMVLRVERKRP